MSVLHKDGVCVCACVWLSSLLLSHGAHSQHNAAPSGATYTQRTVTSHQRRARVDFSPGSPTNTRTTPLGTCPTAWFRQSGSDGEWFTEGGGRPTVNAPLRPLPLSSD